MDRIQMALTKENWSIGRYNLDLDSTRISIEKYKCPTGDHKERVSQPSTIRIGVVCTLLNT